MAYTTIDEAVADGWELVHSDGSYELVKGVPPAVHQHGASAEEVLMRVNSWEAEHASRKPEHRSPLAAAAVRELAGRELERRDEAADDDGDGGEVAA